VHAALGVTYAAAGQIARALAAVAPGTGGKLARTLAARRGIRARYATFGRARASSAEPLIWMHAPSVGEGLQARPVLELLRREHPAWQLAYTHFSPSAERFAASIGAEFADYLPFDTAGDARAALDALRPAALVFSKLDVWPVLVEHAARRGVRTALISATLPPGSSRRSSLAAAILRDAYRRLDAVGAIDAGDAERLVQLGVRPGVIGVTGDTRYDQVHERAGRADRASPLLAPFAGGRPTLVAGSTWPADERPLLDAWTAVRGQARDARLILAPHEPTEAHLEPVERWAAAAGVQLARLGAPGAADAEVVLVDRVGVLGEIYAVATVAYVGGGFHAAGLHSVLEPAAFGVPVLFGPRHEMSRDADLLLKSGGGATTDSAAALAARIGEWLRDTAARERAGRAAREVVHAGLGAARRSADLVAALVRL
jgi:3-deoxy-D-manno-octulosonic-acid transferase